MPSHFEQVWVATDQLTEDLNSLGEDFSIFDDAFNLSLDFPDPLVDTILNEFDHTDMDELLGTPKPDLDKVRHDCMWAGICVEDNKERPNPLDRLLETPIKSEPVCSETPSKDTDVVPSPLCVTPSSRVPSKCNQRSILRTNLNLASAASVVSSDPLRTASQDESDDSGRPETPQSMSSDTEGPNFKHDNDLGSSLLDDDDDDEDEETEVDDEEEEEDEDDDDAPSAAVRASDVTGQTVRSSLHQSHHDSRGHTSRFDSRPQQTVSNHFFNDHSYHLSKTDVSASIPGNLTPSDSGELRHSAFLYLLVLTLWGRATARDSTVRESHDGTAACLYCIADVTSRRVYQTRSYL